MILIDFRRFDGVCQENRAQDEAPGPGPAVEECPDGPGDLRRCTLRRISLFSCYQLWLEVEGGHGRVRSLPVFLLPVDHGERCDSRSLNKINGKYNNIIFIIIYIINISIFVVLFAFVPQ